MVDLYSIILGMFAINVLLHLAGGGNPARLFKVSKPEATAVVQEETAKQSERISQKASGQTLAQEEDARKRAQEYIDYLRANGLSDDAAQVMQQTLLSARGDELQDAYTQLAEFAEGVQGGFMNPEEVNSVGDMAGSMLRKQYEQGQGLNMGEVMTNVRQQAEQDLPRWKELAVKAGTSAEQVGQMGEGLGKFDEGKFNERFQPALERLNLAFQDRDQRLNEEMNARGLMEQGSFAGEGLGRIVSGSQPLDYQRRLMNREYQDAATRAMLEAQAGAEGQQVAEYQARTAEPGVYGQAIEAGASPFEKLGGMTQAEADTGLRIHSDRRADVGQSTSGVSGAAAQKPAAAEATYTARQPELTAAQLRREQTFGGYLGQEATPQMTRLGYKAQVTPGVTGAMGGIGQAGIQSSTQRNLAQTQNLVGGGMAGGQAGLSLLMSDPNLKENIGPLSDERMLEEVRHIPVSEWNYKDDSEEHVGGMTTDMPDEMVEETTEGEAYDPVDYIGMLTGAVRALDKKISKGAFARM